MGNILEMSGPVPEVLGIRDAAYAEDATTAEAGWNEAEREELRARVAARKPFLNLSLSRNGVGGAQKFLVSGEPIFSRLCHFIGYRGVGMDVTERR